MTAKDLKNALLQEAVQGKLVPQIASEGNAKDLLEKIKAEKAKLIKEGKLKKEKPLPEITDDEIPFDIPENWCWCRITDISTCELGKTKDAQKNKGELKDYLCSINIQEDGIDLTNLKQMKFEKDEFDRYTVKKDDLLICEGGDAGRCAIYNKDKPMHYQNALHRVRFFKDINPFFYLYLFQFYKANKLLSEASKGVTIQHLTGTALKELCFPLPPISEQKRIVAKIEQFMPLIDEYGKKEAELTTLNADIAKTLKNAILQEAVQGKLAPQIASEGNARDLIISRKNNKQIRPITEDEILFEIPNNWCWCRLGDLCEIARGGSPRPIKDYITSDPNGYNWIKIGDTEKNGKYINHTAEKIIKEGLKKTRLVHKGDFLLTNSMSFGRPYILNIDGCIHDGWLVISPEKEVFDKDFLYYVLSSSFAYYQFCDSVSGAVVKNLNSDKVRDSLFPLPPIQEQKRIVATIEKMLPLCEKIGE